MAEPKGGEEGHLPPWLLLKFSNISSLKQLLTDMEEKNDFYLVESDSDTRKRNEKKVLKHQTMLLSCPTWNLHLFQYFYFISLFTLFSLFMILFTAFYSWMMLDILQILLLMSYKLACHQLQKIISNIYSLYFLSNTNHIFTPSVCKAFSSYELVIFIYLF